MRVIRNISIFSHNYTFFYRYALNSIYFRKTSNSYSIPDYQFAATA